MSKAPRVWVLMGSRRGDNNQLLALAEALGVPFETRTVQYRWMSRVRWKLFRSSAGHLTRASRRWFEPPHRRGAAKREEQMRPRLRVEPGLLLGGRLRRGAEAVHRQRQDKDIVGSRDRILARRDDQVEPAVGGARMAQPD